jgi:hypothetical protein
MYPFSSGLPSRSLKIGNGGEMERVVMGDPMA